MKILQILNEIAATTKRTEKEAIIKAHRDNDLLKEVFRLAYTPTIQFNIKKIPEYNVVTCESSESRQDLGVVLGDIVQFLVVEKYRGHAAIQYLADQLSTLSEDDAEVVERVIKRDLRVGCTASTANKVWKGLVVDQPCMLASSYKDKLVDKILENENGAFAELKADGARCMAIVDDNNDVRFVSRNGKEYHGLINLTNWIQKMNAHGFVIDGELVYAPLGLMNVKDRSTGNGIVNKASKGTITPREQADIVFQVWDIIPICVYNGSDMSMNMPYSKRKSFLTTLVNTTFNGGGHDRCIEPIPFTKVYTKPEAKKVYRDYVSQGLEGIILKNPDSLWEDKRSQSLVKFKEEHTADLEVIGFVEGEGKYEGMLGAVLLRSACGMLEVSCGSGFSDHERKVIWDNREEYLGTIFEVKYNAVTKAKTGELYSLFLPIFVNIREDKDVANTLDEIYERQE